MHNLKLRLDILKFMMESKIKILGVFNVSFLRNNVEGGRSFFNIFNEGLLKKSLVNHDLQLAVLIFYWLFNYFCLNFCKEEITFVFFTIKKLHKFIKILSLYTIY